MGQGTRGPGKALLARKRFGRDAHATQEQALELARRKLQLSRHLRHSLTAHAQLSTSQRQPRVDARRCQLSAQPGLRKLHALGEVSSLRQLRGQHHAGLPEHVVQWQGCVGQCGHVVAHQSRRAPGVQAHAEGVVPRRRA